MGTNPNKLKRSLLATSIAAACTISSVGVNAQVADEEVVVRGIRASMQAALDIKRNSTGVVDAISSEDIGKMPDANLAESLQRITGVSITRTNGEGATVSIRGIDPALNMVTLNGRNMPAVTNNGTAGNKSSRAFDFAGLASEGVSGVEVYKTGKANVTGGGLGGTINLKTLRPLDAGNKAVLGAKAVQDQSVFNGATGEEFTPELSGLYSFVNDEGSFGVSLVASHQVRDNSRSMAFVNNWQLQEAGAATDTTSDGTLPSTATITNAPASGEFYALPTDLRYSLEDNHRERNNGQLTVQFKPVESVTATVDYTYSEYELSADRSQQSTWYNISAIDAATFDDATVATPIIYSEDYAGGGKDVSFAQQSFESRSENDSFGVNLGWEVTDALSLALDYHNSTAVNRTDQTEIGLNANVVIAEYSEWGGDLPLMGIEFDDSDLTKGNGNGVLDGGDVSSAMGSARFDEQSVNIEQIKLDGVLDLGGLNVKFGGERRVDSQSVLENNGTIPRITMGNWGGVDPDTFGSDWPSYFTTRDFGDSFPDYSSTTGSSEFLNYGLDGDIDKIIETIEWVYDRDIDPANFADFPNGKIQANNSFNLSRDLQETVTAFYVQGQIGFDLAGMAANVVLGLRQESTKVESSALMNIPTAQRWDDNDDMSFDYGAGLFENYTVSHDYSNFLPNLDLDLSITDSLKVRASYSETMGRTSYDNLSSGINFGSQILRQASAGNPALEPMESANIDLSVEWYYSDSSAVTLGFFTKDVSNFVGTVVFEEQLFGLLDPRAGIRFETAQADVTADGGDPNDMTLVHAQMLVNDGQDPTDETTFILAESPDPVQTWDVSRPANGEEDSLSGIELAVQHWFGDSGFGAQFNYTAVDSDLDIDVTSTDQQFAMVGVSDTANLVAMYDNNGLQARIAYNWRDAYLRTTVEGGNNAPGYVAAYKQIDFSVSYDVTDAVTVSLEGLNVTGENSRRYGRSENQMFQLEDLGARYQLGARYTF